MDGQTWRWTDATCPVCRHNLRTLWAMDNPKEYEGERVAATRAEEQRRAEEEQDTGNRGATSRGGRGDVVEKRKHGYRQQWLLKNAALKH